MITQHGPQCDVCGQFIIFDRSINPFSITGIEGTLLSHDACKPKVLEAMAAKDWRLLPEGPLRTAYARNEEVNP